MAEIIAIANQKGGVGKSTTAAAIAAGLALSGYKVLSIDLDGQGNLTHTMQADSKHYNALDLLQGKATAADAIQKTPAGEIIAASPLLSGADKELAGLDTLQKALTPIRGNYDFIIIDTPPALSLVTINAFTAANGVIIPAGADAYSLQGIGQLYDTIQTVQSRLNPALKILGILLTRYSGRAILSRDLAEVITETAANLKTQVFKTRIREAIAIKEAQAMRTDIFTYAPKSNPAKDYSSLLDEILKAI